MPIHTLKGYLEKIGAPAAWFRVVDNGPTTDDPHTWTWIDEIHNRDYRTYEIAKSLPLLYYEPNSESSSPDLIKNRAPVPYFPWSAHCHGTVPGGIDFTPYRWQLNPTSGITQGFGFGGFTAATNTSSPLIQREARFKQTDPSSLPSVSFALPKRTIPGSWTIPAGANNIQAQHDDSLGNSVVTQFPFTLECWARPTSANTDSMSGNSDGSAGGDNGYCPHNILMIACPNPADGYAGQTVTADVPNTWRHWGIGLEESETGVPVIHWGGFKTLGSNIGQNALHVAGPDPTRTAKPEANGNRHNKWAHVVGVFHSRTEVQLFYNGREVAYYEGDPPTGGNFITPAGATVPFQTGQQDNRVPDIATYDGIDQHNFLEGKTIWMGGYQWYRHAAQGVTVTDRRGNFDYAGKIAYPAVYAKALSAKEVMDHYLTMTQGANITIRGEADNWIQAGGSAGSEKGVMAIRKYMNPGLRHCDEIIIRDDVVGPLGSGKNAEYTETEAMSIDQDAAAALRSRYFNSPIGTILAGDGRYQDNAITGFAPEGFGILTCLNICRYGGAFDGVNASATLMDFTGVTQYDQPGGTDAENFSAGFKTQLVDVSGYIDAYGLTSARATNTTDQNLSINWATFKTDDPLVDGQRHRTHVFGMFYDTLAGNMWAGWSRWLNLSSPGAGAQSLSGSGFVNTWSLRTYHSGIGKANSDGLVPWQANDHKFQIGPTALLFGGGYDGIASARRRFSGVGATLRTRFPANKVRRHMGLKRNSPNTGGTLPRGAV